MNKLKYILTVFTLALLAACSQDDAFTGTNEEDATETVAVTFNAQVDYSIAEAGSGAEAPASIAATRSDGTADEMPTRYYAQAITQDGSEATEVVEGTVNPAGGCNFRLNVKPGVEYDFLFWADNATGNPAPDNLRAVPYAKGSVAFACQSKGTAGSAVTDITLGHVVAKVSLMSTTEVPEGTVISLTCSSGTIYNVLTKACSESEPFTFEYTTGRAIGADNKVAATYLLPTDNRAITVSVNGHENTINNVPLEANTCITLKGDLSGTVNANAVQEGF